MIDSAAFHVGVKAAWKETISRDRGATAFDVRVAVMLAGFVSVDGIVRRVSQERIAQNIGATERGVRNSIKRLRRLGYLELLPEDSADFGRKHTAEYRLLKPQKTRNGGSGFSGETRNGEAQKAERKDTKPGTAVPPLPLSFHKESSACAHADMHDASTLSDEVTPRQLNLRAKAPRKRPHLWQAIKERLGASERFGKDKVEAWLDKLTLYSIIDGRMTLLASSSFVARQINADFADQILDAWRAIDPRARCVRVEHMVHSMSTGKRA